jgi:hypothetical protein
MPDRNATQKVLRCYRCGASLRILSLPLARLDFCPECTVELHVCRMCKQYAPSAPDACTEEDAPAVHNKTTANFCDYFDPDPGVFDGNAIAADAAARDRLNALFGEEVNGESPDSREKSSAEKLLDQAESLFKY